MKNLQWAPELLRLG